MLIGCIIFSDYFVLAGNYIFAEIFLAIKIKECKTENYNIQISDNNF